MRLKYRPLFDNFPPLQRVKPIIAAEHRHRAKQSPPPALPLHCKPWVDASSYGVLLTFPYKTTLTIYGRPDASPTFTMSPASTQLIYGPLGQMFSKEHFSLGSGYWFKTDPGVGIFTNHLPDGYQSRSRLVPGLVECWRYPKRLFVVFRAPAPGETIKFEYGDPLCVLMPVATGVVGADLMTTDEWQVLKDQRRRWDEHRERHPELEWTSAEGTKFTHMYKVFGKREAPGDR